MVFECKGLENRVNDIESSITDLNNEKLDKTSVVQVSGTGTDVVMSQKAVTDAIASADPTAEKLHEVIKGTSTVTVDLSQDQQTLNVALDKSQEVQYVELTPTTATQGILTDTQWNVLQVNKGNCIILNNEIYRLADNQNVNGLITYVHTGWDGTARKDKSISITVSTKAWTLVVAEGGGGNVYLHSMEFDGESSTASPYYVYFYSTFNTSITYDNINEYSTQIPFGVLCYLDENGEFKFSGIITGINQGSPGKIIFSRPGIGTQLMLKLNSDTVTEV